MLVSGEVAIAEFHVGFVQKPKSLLTMSHSLSRRCDFWIQLMLGNENFADAPVPGAALQMNVAFQRSEFIAKFQFDCDAWTADQATLLDRALHRRERRHCCQDCARYDMPPFQHTLPIECSSSTIKRDDDWVANPSLLFTLNKLYPASKNQALIYILLFIQAPPELIRSAIAVAIGADQQAIELMRCIHVLELSPYDDSSCYVEAWKPILLEQQEPKTQSSASKYKKGDWIEVNWDGPLSRYPALSLRSLPPIHQPTYWDGEQDTQITEGGEISPP